MRADLFAVCSPALLKQRALDQPADLRRHTLIHDQTCGRRGGPPGWPGWLAAANAAQVDAQRGPVFSSTYMALEAALAGHGVALAPAPLVTRDIAAGRLARPLPLALENPYAFWIVCPRQHLQDPRIKAVSAWLIEQASQP
jgi:LysR family glycine cleavage system transcriptional activator